MNRRSFLSFIGGVVALPSTVWSRGVVKDPQWQLLRQKVGDVLCECRYRIDREATWYRSGQVSIDWIMMQQDDTTIKDDFQFPNNASIWTACRPGGAIQIPQDEVYNVVGTWPELHFDGKKVWFAESNQG